MCLGTDGTDCDSSDFGAMTMTSQPPNKALIVHWGCEDCLLT